MRTRIKAWMAVPLLALLAVVVISVAVGQDETPAPTLESLQTRIVKLEARVATAEGQVALISAIDQRATNAMTGVRALSPAYVKHEERLRALEEQTHDEDHTHDHSLGVGETYTYTGTGNVRVMHGLSLVDGSYSFSMTRPASGFMNIWIDHRHPSYRALQLSSSYRPQPYERTHTVAIGNDGDHNALLHAGHLTTETHGLEDDFEWTLTITRSE